jgi:hypothetical protein
MKMQATTLLVNFGTSYLQVAHYNGRYFLRDGYHRAAGWSALASRLCV